MSTTATNYINLIRRDYPVRGRDNDSQGFRDNFTNISKALETINQDISDLSNIAVLSNTTATFYGNNIEDANFQNCSTELWDNGTLSGNIFIDYTLGSYQTLRVESGLNNINIINWPGEGKAGHLTLSITPTNNISTTVNFAGTNINSLGPSENPFLLFNGAANVFEITSEYPAGADENKIYVRLSNELVTNSTTTQRVSADEFVLKSQRRPYNQSENHTLSVSSATGASSATIIQSQVVGYPVAGNLAIVPNRISRRIVAVDPTGFVTVNTAVKIQLNSVQGIMNGATFHVITTNTTLTVTTSSSVDNTITCTPAFPVGIGTGNILFRNPKFGDEISGVLRGEKTAFPTVMTLLDGPDYVPANTSTGRMNVLKGSIYASENALEVTFRDYGDGIRNTFTATIMPTTTVTNNTFDFANTKFVHLILPAGSVIMWYGIDTNIPYGWGVCDGTTYTDPVSGNSVKSPDLRNKFIVAADATTTWNAGDPANSRVATSSVTGINTSTGGSAELKVVSHSHSTTGTITSLPHFHEITDPGHFHVLTDKAGVLAGDNVGGADIDNERGATDNDDTTILQKNSKNAFTDITVNSTVTQIGFNITAVTTGTVTPGSNNDNVPPFYALYYIIKWAGA